MKNSVFVIGGLGHIGLTLSSIIGQKCKVYVYDTDKTAQNFFKTYKQAVFEEPQVDDLLFDANIELASSLKEMKKCKIIIITIGTPVDEYLNPDLKPMFFLFEQMIPFIRDEHLIILRSTVYPGMTKKLQKLVRRKSKFTQIVFCPERVAGGVMIKEIQELPQIVAANDDSSLERASEFFRDYVGVKEIILLHDTTSGELAKLFTNAYRYINFAIPNQMFMIAQDMNCDFYEIHKAITYNYPRMKSFPKPGWTAGYCLRKDTLQLASLNKSHTFSLGYDASVVNEFMPLYIFRKIREKYGPLYDKTIGLLGMAFKGGTDDIRDSLAYRMRNILLNECKRVLCTDAYALHEYFVDANFLVKKSDIIILMAPHEEYLKLNFKSKVVIDVFNFFGKGVGI